MHKCLKSESPPPKYAYTIVEHSLIRSACESSHYYLICDILYYITPRDLRQKHHDLHSSEVSSLFLRKCNNCKTFSPNKFCLISSCWSAWPKTSIILEPILTFNLSHLRNLRWSNAQLTSMKQICNQQ